MRRKFQLLTGSYVLAAAMSVAFGSTPAAPPPYCTVQSCTAYCESQNLAFGHCNLYLGCICSDPGR